MSMQPDDLAKAEQGFALIADTYPSFWARFYTNLQQQKTEDDEPVFTKVEAFSLLCLYIQQILSNTGDNDE